MQFVIQENSSQGDGRIIENQLKNVVFEGQDVESSHIEERDSLVLDESMETARTISTTPIRLEKTLV